MNRGNQRTPAKSSSSFRPSNGNKNSNGKAPAAGIARAPASSARSGPAAPAAAGSTAKAEAKPEAKILFQKFFKSVGPRTYASQIKEAGNGNHFLVLTEGKRDEATGEVKKIRLFVFSEDFREFFHMLHETAQFIKANPVPEEVRQRRERHWAKKGDSSNGGGAPAMRSLERKPQAVPSGKKR